MSDGWVPSIRWKAELRATLVEFFTEQQLTILASDCDVDFQKTTTAGRPFENRVQEVIDHMCLTGSLRCFVDNARTQRPNSDVLVTLASEMPV